MYRQFDTIEQNLENRISSLDCVDALLSKDLRRKRQLFVD
jgi:hypothetical protein